MNAHQPTRYPYQSRMHIIAPVFSAAHVSTAVEELTGRAMAPIAKRECKAVAKIGENIPVPNRPSRSARHREADEASMRVLEYLEQHGGKTGMDLAQALHMSHSRASQLCLRLIKLGTVTRWRDGNSGPYTYNVTGKDAVLREQAKVTEFIEAIKRNPGITATELAAMLGRNRKYVTDTARLLDMAGRIVRSRPNASVGYTYYVSEAEE